MEPEMELGLELALAIMHRCHRVERARGFDKRFEEAFMRDVVVAAIAASWLMILGAPPAHAVGTRHPFCLQGEDYPGLSYCAFDNYGQCMATASGRFLTCIANPYFAGPTDDPYASRNRHRRYRSGYDQPY
jgi:Protein of unknown function (DUF3551)